MGKVSLRYASELKKGNKASIDIYSSRKPLKNNFANRIDAIVIT